jgi:hypothetical protein
MREPVSYALLAANAYAATQSPTSPNVSAANEITLPENWSVIRNRANPETSFLARAYKNAETNEIVIAYGGTTSEEGMKTLDWTKGNLKFSRYRPRCAAPFAS